RSRASAREGRPPNGSAGPGRAGRLRGFELAARIVGVAELRVERERVFEGARRLAAATQRLQRESLVIVVLGPLHDGVAARALRELERVVELLQRRIVQALLQVDVAERVGDLGALGLGLLRFLRE